MRDSARTQGTVGSGADSGPLRRLAAALLTFAVVSIPVTGQDEKAAESPVTIEALVVTPDQPGLDTLCQLRVRLRNEAEQPVSGLRFVVRIGGKPLTVYETQVFMDVLPPGATTEVPLYNFWTTETDRPAPKDGKLALEVTLVDARFLRIETGSDAEERDAGEGDAASGDAASGDPVAGDPVSGDPVETWTLLASIPAMPPAAKHTIALIR